jgi:hypothetical protein
MATRAEMIRRADDGLLDIRRLEQPHGSRAFEIDPGEWIQILPK